LKPGNIILIDFPFTDPTQSKVRPAVIITDTKDRYHDLIVCAISSVIPEKLLKRDILLSKTDPDYDKTGLRADSVIKIDRIATLKQTSVISKLGECSPALWEKIVAGFKTLADK
jgi:mRNA interferase MazF